MQVRVGAEFIAIFRIDGRFYATSDSCTHEEASLCDGFVEGDTIECPMHQATFHIPTGRALREPAKTDLRTFPVRVVDAAVEVQV